MRKTAQAILLCSALAPSFAGLAFAQASAWSYLKERPAGIRRAATAAEDRSFDSIRQDFARTGPSDFRRYPLKVRVLYDDPATGRRTILLMITGVDDVEAAYGLDRQGRILDRRLYSYWDWPSSL